VEKPSRILKAMSSAEHRSYILWATSTTQLSTSSKRGPNLDPTQRDASSNYDR